MKSSHLMLPGFTDVHVHLREPGNTHKEDFSTGTKAAIAGGFTQVLDMPNNIPPTVTPKDLNQKIKLAAGRIWCDVGFNFGATKQSAIFFNKISSKVFGLKVYMNQTTGPLLVDNPKDREIIFKSWTSPLPIMVHAEGQTVDAAIALAKKYKKRLHICHVTANQMPSIISAKKSGLEISCEVTPHHLFLNSGDLKKLGSFGMMKPSLLTKKEQELLWVHIDDIDMIATDHAPHTMEEKYDQSSPKFGVPGLETTLPLMLSAVADGRISMEKLTDMLSTKPRQIFHLPEQPDTYIMVDYEKTYQIKSLKLFTKCNWTPFKNLKGRGVIKKVVLRGKTVYQNGKFIGQPQGQIMHPDVRTQYTSEVS